MLDVFHQRWVYKQIIEEHVKYKYDGSMIYVLYLLN